MAELAIISETGMFHSLCRCTFAASKIEWYGFAPIQKGSPRGPGDVHTEARPQLINHMITFDVPDTRLHNAINQVCGKYRTSNYQVLVRDCVSFSADMARAVGLRVPMVNMTPWGLIQILRVNTYKTLS